MRKFIFLFSFVILNFSQLTANERNIELNNLFEKLKDDNPILNYLNDDGTDIEPDYYLPILPILVTVNLR